MNPTTVKEFLQLLPGRLNADAAEDLDVVYQFDLSGAQGGQRGGRGMAMLLEGITLTDAQKVKVDSVRAKYSCTCA